MLDYQLNQIYKEVKGKITPQEKSSLVIQIADILSEIKNPVISDDYIKVASFKLGVSEEILKAQVKNKQQDEFLILKVENELPLNINKIIQKDTQNQLELMEENLIKLGFSANDYEKQSYFREKIKNIKLNNEANSRVLQSIDKKIDEVNNVDELAKKVFFEFYSEQEIQKKISDNIFSSHEFDNLTQENYKKAIDETLTRLNKLKHQYKKDELKRLLKDDSLSQEEKEKLSAKIFEELKQQ